MPGATKLPTGLTGQYFPDGSIGLMLFYDDTQYGYNTPKT